MTFCVYCLSSLDMARQEGIAQGRALERAEILEWLRSRQMTPGDDYSPLSLASDIERGAHVEKP